jgi:hypothetical protein
MSARIRHISLNGQPYYVVEFGEDFVLFNFISPAMLYCTVDLNIPYEVI